MGSLNCVEFGFERNIETSDINRQLPLLQKNAKKAKFTNLALTGILLLATGLRLFRISEKPVWLDEGFSIWLSLHSIANTL